MEHRHRSQTTPGEALFSRPRRPLRPAIPRSAAPSSSWRAATRRHQHIYVSADGVGPDKSLQVLLRVFWTDAQRLEYFFVLGMVVDPAAMTTHPSQSRSGPSSTRFWPGAPATRRFGCA